VLVPFSLALAVLLGASVFGMYWLQTRQADEQARANVDSVDYALQNLLTEEAAQLDGLIYFLKADEDLKRAWLSKDRGALLRYSEPILNDIRSYYRVTYLKFIDLERVCFLRVHNPPDYGDTIPWFTLAAAVRKGIPVSGIELAKSGTLTLRSVHPWRIDGELLGYMELGTEIDHLTSAVEIAVGVDLFFAIDKRFLDPADWAAGVEMEGHAGNWDKFEDFVVHTHSSDQVPPAIVRHWKHMHTDHSNCWFDVSHRGRDYSVGFVDLVDAGGHDIGDLVIATDITETRAALETLLSILVTFSVLIGAALIWVFYVFLGRIEHKLNKSRDDLVAEIERRGMVEQVLQERSWELGERVKELTCLHSLSQLLEDPHRTWDGLFQEVVNIIPPAWQYPEITCARLVIDGQEFATENYRPTRWEQAVTISVSDCQAGSLHVRYLEERPNADEGPFLKEQRSLIEALATEIGKYVERQRQEEQLRKLSAAVDQSANMICITDPEGTIGYVNPQFCRSTGYSSGEIIGQKPIMFMCEQKDENPHSGLWETITLGGTWSDNIHNRRKDGKLFWARTTVSPLFDNRGDIVNYLIVAEDITSELLTQQRLAVSDKLAAIGTLAAGVAHEFKNYLAGIMGHASFALGELDDADALEVAREALDQVVQLSEGANNVAMSLLTYSKADTENLLEENLTDIVNNSVALVEKEFKNRSIKLVVHLEKVPRIIVSAGKIQQLLLNLLINAQHAVGSDGVITVHLNRMDEHVRVVVADTGKGIPPDNLSRVFDPFFSTKGVWGKEEVAGTGMGLSICRNIAREHGGDLTVESMIGVGTTFTLLLPIKTGASPTGRPTDQPRYARVMVFSLDDALANSLRCMADDSGVEIVPVDNVAGITRDLSDIADLVVLDGNFSGKVELYRMSEVCRSFNVPFVVVNRLQLGHSFGDLLSAAEASFDQVPALPGILFSSGAATPSP